LTDIVDEIVVIHDGECQDKSLEIAREYTDRIYVVEYAGEAEIHRPFSFEMAKNEWILQIDADEFLPEDAGDYIKNIIRNKNVDAYEFLWPIWNGKKYISRNWPHKRCLFRKNKISFLGIPHYIAEVSGNIKKIDLILEHRPESINYNWQSFNDKWIKWAKIQANVYSKKFSTIKKFNYTGVDWPKKIMLRRRFPLLLIPLEFIVTLYKNLSNGGWRSGWVSYRYSFLCGLYRIMINYYIFLNKKNDN